MKILMFGRGVISSTYGWALEKAGHTIHYYVRPGRAQLYGGSLDVHIKDMRQGFFNRPVEESMHIECLEKIGPDHDYDLIFLSVQHYNFAQAAETVATFVGNATVLIFNNFWEEPLEATSVLPADQLVWGFPAAGGGIDDNKLSAVLVGSVTLGTFGQPATPRDTAVREMFAESGFKVKPETDFRAWLFIHFAQNAGFQSELLLPEHRPKPVLSLNTFYNAMLNANELIPVLEARDIDLKSHKSAMVMRLPVVVSSALLWLVFKLIAPLRSVIEWHNNPFEAIHTSRDALEGAKRLGIGVPRLESKPIETSSQLAEAAQPDT